MIIGVGVDLVHIPSFTEQLELPGTIFTHAFSGAELRYCKKRATQTGSVYPHLAARWAAKEAVIKAWSSALHPNHSVLKTEDIIWAQIEVVNDSIGRPRIQINKKLEPLIIDSLIDIYGPTDHLTWHLSLSHDGDSAIATVIAEWR